MNTNTLDGIDSSGDPLMVAFNYSKAASELGFDWDDDEGVLIKLGEEFREVWMATTPDEMVKEAGDMMFVLVNLIRTMGFDNPVEILRETNEKFYKRFTRMENHARSVGRELSDCSFEEMGDWWRTVAREED